VWWVVYNKQLFGSLLPMPKFVVVDIEHCGEYLAGTITISSRMSTPDLAKATLLHEMIHQWQDHTGEKIGHGATFKDWAGMIRAVTNLEVL
jgi:hypothetical protein